MTLLAQADTITALEHLILAVIDKASVGGMFLVAYILGFVSFPLMLKALGRMGIRTGRKQGE